ncbi:hypothetical protein E3J62_10850 [candidate division TA06 bacterium]|uniref:Uncharacterized protein n=1 Tax=candidate division TA06 bacterium TaxID=2250710 RepID=A0A523UPS4_UNCT6|nr:MAG: hypothetical protein E3J62_10850 [candidate division TA06 bacterium]
MMRAIIRISKSLSLLVGVIGIVLALFFFAKSRKFKALTATIEASASVLEVPEPVPELTILYRGKEIEELYVLVLKIRNTGNLDITPKDFFGTFHFNTNASVVDAKIIETYPDNLGVALEVVGPEKVGFTKSLFKVGEWFKVKVTLLSAPQLDFSMNRIADLKRIVVVESAKPRTFPALLKYILQIIGGGLAALSIFIVAVNVILTVPASRTRAKEASLKSNMHTVQLAVEDFSTMAEGLYPATINATVAEVLRAQGHAAPPSATLSIVEVGAGDPATGVQIAESENSLLPSSFRNPLYGERSKPALGTWTERRVPQWSEETVGIVWYVPIGVKGKSAAGYMIYGVGAKQALSLVLTSGN